MPLIAALVGAVSGGAVGDVVSPYIFENLRPLKRIIYINKTENVFDKNGNIIGTQTYPEEVTDDSSL
jgi:hypothetical protein